MPVLHQSLDVLVDGMNFFRSVSPQRFEVKTIVVHKPTIYSAASREHKDRFYNYFVKTLINSHARAMVAADIRIDGSGDRVFKRELNAYLRRQLPTGCVRSV